MLSRIIWITAAVLTFSSLTTGCFWHHHHHHFRASVEPTSVAPAER